MVLRIEYSGAKMDGVAKRKLYFVAPATAPRADTEGLDAIPPEQRIAGQLSTPLEAPRILLLTYNQHEFEAVRALFWDGPQNQQQRASPPTRKTGLEVVDDLGEHGGWQVLHGHSGQGNRNAQRSADCLRRAHTPYAIISLGIAFGADEKKQDFGDVLVSKFIVDYELARVSQTSIGLRGARPPATHNANWTPIFANVGCPDCAFLEKAEKIIDLEKAIRLTNDDAAMIIELLENQAKPNEALSRALESYREKIANGSLHSTAGSTT